MHTFRALCWLALPLLAGIGGVQAEPVQIPLETAATGTFYIKAGINARVETELLLDTGSGYVALSRRTFARVQDGVHHEPERTITGLMADGKAVAVPLYRIAELKLGADCVLHDVEVAVFEHAARDILGLNALKQMQPFTLQLDPPQLSANCG